MKYTEEERKDLLLGNFFLENGTKMLGQDFENRIFVLRNMIDTAPDMVLSLSILGKELTPEDNTSFLRNCLDDAVNAGGTFVASLFLEPKKVDSKVIKAQEEYLDFLSEKQGMAEEKGIPMRDIIDELRNVKPEVEKPKSEVKRKNGNQAKTNVR